MGFTSYRATRSINLGQIREDLRPGDIIDFDGVLTRVRGKEHRIANTGVLIMSGWLVPADAPLVPVMTPPPPPPAPAPSGPAKPEERHPVLASMSPEAKEADGKRPKANQQHVWGGGPNSPDWLNSLDSGGRTCRVCGVTENPSLIRADRMRGNGKQQFHYVDAHGNAITSFEELSCPTYLGDPGSAAAIAKEHVRRVRGRVDEIDGKLETVDDRLDKLEADNEFLRQRLLEQPILDANMVAEALLIIAQKARPDGQNALVEKVRALLPAPLWDADALHPVLEAELVEVRRDEDPTSGSGPSSP